MANLPKSVTVQLRVDTHAAVARLVALRAELDVLIEKLRELDGPHSRACDYMEHEHGIACHPNCPTCYPIQRDDEAGRVVLHASEGVPSPVLIPSSLLAGVEPRVEDVVLQDMTRAMAAFDAKVSPLVGRHRVSGEPVDEELVSDEPGKIWKLTGHGSLSDPHRYPVGSSICDLCGDRQELHA